jgi:CheY-like chemotaxis protein
LALVDDLIFQAKIAETARHVGVELCAVSSVEALLREAAGSAAPASLIILDLNARADALEALRRLRDSGRPQRVVAYLSHVQVELAEQARAAGCARVLARSKFSRHLPEILAEAKT